MVVGIRERVCAASTGIEGRGYWQRNVGDYLRGDLEGVDSGFASVVMKLSHEILGGLFSLFFPFDP